MMHEMCMRSKEKKKEDSCISDFTYLDHVTYGYDLNLNFVYLIPNLTLILVLIIIQSF